MPECGVATATEYHVYSTRHIVLFVYWLSVFTCGFFQNSFAPVADVIEHVFHTNVFGVSMFINISMLINIPISFLSPTLFEKKGLRSGLRFGSFLLCASGWVRYGASLLVTQSPSMSYWCMLLGQMVMSVGFPVLLAACPLLSSAWYSSDGRAIATAVGGLASVIGTAGVSIVAPMFFPVGSGSPALQLQSFMLAEAVLGTTCVAGMLFLPAGPPSPPSASDKARRHSQMLRTDSGTVTDDSVMRALRCGSFRVLMLIMGCGYASFQVITTLINEILRPAGLPDDDIGNIGSAIGLGILSSFVVGAAADITKRFTLIGKIIGTLMAVGFLMFAVVSCQPDVNMWWPFATLGFMGFFGIPCVPLMMELGVEVLYPMSESMSGSLLWGAGNLMGVLASFLAANLNVWRGRLHHTLPILCVVGVMQGVCVIGVCFFNGKMRRQEFEAIRET